MIGVHLFARFSVLGVMEIKHQLLPVLPHRRQTVLEF